MKRIKIALSVICTAISVGCSTDFTDEVIDSPSVDTATNSTRVSMIDIGKYLEVYKGIEETRSEEISIEPIVYGRDTVMYLVNYDEGWEVLSGDCRAPMVLVQCDSGNITKNELVTNPSEEEFFNTASEYIAYLQANPDIIVDKNESDWHTISDYPFASTYTRAPTSWVRIKTEVLSETIDRQPHLLKTRWGQDSPWNSKTPYASSAKTYHCPTGCVMVAVAQVLYYLHYKIGVPEKTYEDCSVTTFIPDGQSLVQIANDEITLHDATYTNNAWDYMPLSMNQEGMTSFNYDVASTLMTQLGYLLGAAYKPDATSASIHKIPAVLDKNFGITCIRTSYDASKLYEQIYTNKMPVIVSAYYTNDSGDIVSGHAFVIDGYKKVTQRVRYTYVTIVIGPDGNSQEKYKTEYETVVTHKICMNWGWDGSYDDKTENGVTDCRWYSPTEASWKAEGYDFSIRPDLVYGFTAN